MWLIKGWTSSGSCWTWIFKASAQHSVSSGPEGDMSSYSTKPARGRGALRELHSLSPFSSAPPEKERNKQRKGRWENHAKTGRKVLGEQKPECLCNWEVSAYLWPLCAALLPGSVGISRDISGDHDSWISPPFPRVCWDQEQGSGCKTQLNPRSFPFTHLKHCTTLMPCAPRQGSAGWCQRESAAFVSHFY